MAVCEKADGMVKQDRFLLNEMDTIIHLYGQAHERKVSEWNKTKKKKNK